MAFDPVAKVLCYTGHTYPILFYYYYFFFFFFWGGGVSLNREIRSPIQFVRTECEKAWEEILIMF